MAITAPSPSEIAAELRKRVIGQREAKLLELVEFPVVQCAGGGVVMDEIQKMLDSSGKLVVKPMFSGGVGKKGKAGLIGFTKSLARELGPRQVTVNAVAPGYIRTTQLTEQVPAEIMDQAREKSVLGRLGDPQDVAQLVLFLCSEEARHITGAVVPVDGGYLL